MFASYLRGTLYVLGGACAYVAANIFLPHDLRSWAGFICGAVGNTCILMRAYLDQSHTKYNVGKPITEMEPPVSVTVTNTQSDPVPVTTEATK